MEKKFKVGDLVRCIDQQERPFGRIGKVVKPNGSAYFVDFGIGFQGHTLDGTILTETGWNLLPNEIELAYPSDHDLLDFAARDSKIAELTAENEALKAELEKYKPKPESWERKVVVCQSPTGHCSVFISKVDDSWDDYHVIARKFITITEGEGM